MDVEWIKSNMDKIPTGAMIIVAIAHLVGIIVGMVVATKIAVNKLLPAYVVGVLLIVATAVNLFMIPHPIWFTVTDIAGALVGFGIGKILSERVISV